MKKFALLSVYNKTGIIELANQLLNNNYSIISTGGTYKKLEEIQNDNIFNVEDFTGFPEILNGRVKTLNPKLLGGILAKRNNKEHLEDLQQIQTAFIDLVVVNLYPFQEVISNENHTHDEAIENIDIGGVTLIRAACKNYKYVKILTEPNDYQYAFYDNEYTNLYLSNKGWEHVTNYDMAITQYFNKDIVYRKYTKEIELKYGCNPNQKNANLFSMKDTVPLTLLNGEPGYINLLDALSSWQLVKEISVCGYPVVASFKHTTPAGVAIGKDEIDESTMKSWCIKDKVNSKTAIAFIRARQADPLSSFGDFIAISEKVDKETALLIKKEVSDGIIAPDYDKEAYEILRQKKNGKYLILKMNNDYDIKNITEYREIFGMVLSQDKHDLVVNMKDMNNWATTKNTNDVNVLLDLFIANCTLKYTPSNSIVYAYNGQVIGVGAGQQNRVDCVKLAGNKAMNWWKRLSPCIQKGKFTEEYKRQEKVNLIMEFINSNQNKNNFFEKMNEDNVHMSQIEEMNIVMASDAFFPFSDSIIEANKRGVKYIIQPGGSLADNNVIDMCNESDMGMCFTGVRMFYH